MGRVRIKTTKARRSGAVSRIIAGSSTAEEEARRLHVTTSAVRAWVTMAKRGTRAGRKKKREGSKLERELNRPIDDRDEREPRSGRLERALRSAELEDGAGVSEEDSRVEEASTSSAVPPPDPAALVAFTETLRGQALKIYAGVVGVDVTDPRAVDVFTFTQDERRTLELWAPYAAKYVPVLIGQSEEVGAWIFVGVNVASLWTGMAHLRRLAPKKARNASDTFPGPGDPDLSRAAAAMARSLDEIGGTTPEDFPEVSADS